MVQTDVVLVVGQRGCGKTTWAKNYVQRQPRAIVLDASFGEFGIQQYTDLDQMVRDLEGKSFFRVSYSPRQYEVPLLFDIARIKGAEKNRAGLPQKCLLTLEEADRLEDPQYFPEYDECISRGRHYGVDLMGISLYPTKLPMMLRRMATRVIAFRHIEPRDIQYLGEVIGDAAVELPGLKNFEYIDWNQDTGATIKRLGGKIERKNPVQNAETVLDKQEDIEGMGEDDETEEKELDSPKN